MNSSKYYDELYDYALNIVSKYEELLDEICIAIPEYEYTYLFDLDRDTILLNPVPYQEEKRDVNESKKEEIFISQKILIPKILIPKISIS